MVADAAGPAWTTKSLTRSHEDHEDDDCFFVSFVNAQPSWFLRFVTSVNA